MDEPLLTRLQNHIAQMAPHQQERHGGKLLIEAAKEIAKLYEDNFWLNSQLRSLAAKIPSILKGIDATEQIDDTSGWWETSSGAQFGKSKLREIETLFEAATKVRCFRLTGHVTPIEPMDW